VRQRVVFIVVRLAGMAVAGTAGWQLGSALASYPAAQPAGGGQALRYVLLLTVAGAALGLVVTPYLTVVPLRRLWAIVRSASADTLLGAGLGLLAGLLAAAMAAFPVSLLPDPFGRWLPTGVAVLLAWLGITVGAVRKDEVVRLLLPSRRGGGAPPESGRAPGALDGGVVGPVVGAGGAQPPVASAAGILLDTSAIVDGRVVAIRESGFLRAGLAVPRFVLEELQSLADAADPQRRQRGRRGLDMLERLRREADLAVIDVDYPDLRGVDAKLIRLARQRQVAIVTTDYNLHRVAGLQGVTVLNVNDLGNALRTVVVPGEELTVELVQPGRERGQGIGFLDDGTMVVVEGGRRLLGERVGVEAVRVVPTAGGRIVFSRPRPAPPAPAPPAPAHRARSEGGTSL
jgi:uncharacterized protein YacL